MNMRAIVNINSVGVISLFFLVTFALATTSEYKCPNSTANTEGSCEELCDEDSDCTFGELCCSNGCGKLCLQGVVDCKGETTKCDELTCMMDEVCIDVEECGVCQKKYDDEEENDEDAKIEEKIKLLEKRKMMEAEAYLKKMHELKVDDFIAAKNDWGNKKKSKAVKEVEEAEESKTEATTEENVKEDAEKEDDEAKSKKKAGKESKNNKKKESQPEISSGKSKYKIRPKDENGKEMSDEEIQDIVDDINREELLNNMEEQLAASGKTLPGLDIKSVRERMKYEDFKAKSEKKERLKKKKKEKERALKKKKEEEMEEKLMDMSKDEMRDYMKKMKEKEKKDKKEKKNKKKKEKNRKKDEL